MKLRCLAIDDESMARKILEENIRQLPFLELVRSCKNAFEAMESLQKDPVDLMFLDIQMPGMLGTQLLQSLAEKPMVIFITAYSNYAVESYDLDVIDYLMKPVSLERFSKAAHKALDEYKKRQALFNPVSHPPLQTKSVDDQSDFFFVNVEYSLVKIPIKDITHVEGMKDYVKIYLSTLRKPVLTKSTLKGLEEKLPEQDFMRVHKSFIIRLDKIESIRRNTIRIGQYDIPVADSNMDDLYRHINYPRKA
ncbi:MAG: response regulator transcription factor [Saprospiraceae bacterium]|nr:response regulator transcription factor [Saprospiraceae bacterium]MCB0574852.1 response regulator transcription factor [Saprospiraceae bacterium]MCB9306745.1 response regulator transcription factor [Lewinellaceae bacterium]